MTDQIDVPAGLRAKILRDRAAGGAVAARWVTDCPKGARALCLVADGDGTTAELFAGRIGVAPYGTTAWLEFGDGAASSQMLAAVLVGSADDPDSPRPTVGDWVLVLDAQIEYAVGMLAVVDQSWSDLRRDARAVVTMPNGERFGGVAITGWAILPAPWQSGDDDEFEGRDGGVLVSPLLAGRPARIGDLTSAHLGLTVSVSRDRPPIEGYVAVGPEVFTGALVSVEHSRYGDDGSTGIRLRPADGSNVLHLVAPASTACQVDQQ